jgi:hypothetical protein
MVMFTLSVECRIVQRVTTQHHTLSLSSIAFKT